ncbi:hypothetical protein ASPSYDRAFT_158185 [Aspergillus sydowii CBS 593.65]|uniref:Uncharacterized protein n=1 Tax=Aspergillus sydowii CBS 593.65 TaxID=1036612 RepID=A0A1L9T812_9EURO|nr:uncharacterized protein ASPSYDRAFT_158185 [Aspergillus sydowii CBS 593.65]OJJ55570.1 hypothetical protein ASPSYDRAFT_158185 [Aspergillus sydowii CBS 593.65]
MPNLPPYQYTGPVDCTIPPDPSKLKGKSVIVTGGANGMGETTVREFAAAGAFVTIADLNVERGEQVARELAPNAQFVKCNIVNWDEQVQVFEAAIANSPSKSCDIVIANAGISRANGDSLWPLDDVNAPPVKPTLSIVDVNLTGTLYTWKLAVHYFRKQPDTEDRDRCFIITGSLVAWIDSPANWQYTCTKYALRGLMRVARRNSWEQGIRINYVAPCYIKSAIRSPAYEAELISKGVEFAPQEDVAKCFMRIATDRTMNGHSLMITPASVAKEGFKDIDMDDHTEGYFKDTQELQLRIIEDQWVEGWSKGRTAEGGLKT